MLVILGEDSPKFLNHWSTGLLGKDSHANMLNPSELDLTYEGKEFLTSVYQENIIFTQRVFSNLIRVACTISRLKGDDAIELESLNEALTFMPKFDILTT